MVDLDDRSIQNPVQTNAMYTKHTKKLTRSHTSGMRTVPFPAFYVGRFCRAIILFFSMYLHISGHLHGRACFSNNSPPPAPPLGLQKNAGKATAATIRAELKAQVEAIAGSTEAFAPGLAVVLVGDRRDSATYVRMKKKACEEIGINSFGFDFPEDVTQDVSTGRGLG